MNDQPFYAAWAEHYDDVFPVGPKAGFVAGRFPAAARLLDLGCATGGLAFALAERGFEVCGVDLDAALVARAQQRLRGEPTPGLSFSRGDMLALPSPPSPFHGVLCLGNTLVHLLDRQQRIATLRSMAGQVGVGGGLLVQIVNYDRVLEQAVEQLPLIDNSAVRFERRYVQLSPAGLCFEARLLVKATGRVLSVAQPLFPLTRGALHDELLQAGWEPRAWFGGYGGAPLGPESFGCMVHATRAG